jgi:hypothetical protein
MGVRAAVKHLTAFTNDLEKLGRGGVNGGNHMSTDVSSQQVGWIQILYASAVV